jgi:homocysteine S-methyltransferase
MPRYRQNLPQLSGASFITDGGLETTLVFHRGVDLPHFAAFPLLDSDAGRAELDLYFKAYLDLAASHGVGLVLDTATWRANRDWGARLGYDAEGLKRINAEAVRHAATLRDRLDSPSTPCVINGVIGPRGDGYRNGAAEAAEAEDYHSLQAEAFAKSEADMISAITMNNLGEAIGIARAAARVAMPCVVSFTVETDGRLADGLSLREAVERTDDATGGSPAYFMVNCAHPTHFEPALERGEAWTARIWGVRANASAKSHAELDESTEIDIGDRMDLARRYRALRRSFPRMSVLGGCCGTDHTHVDAICEACLPIAA